MYTSMCSVILTNNIETILHLCVGLQCTAVHRAVLGAYGAVGAAGEMLIIAELHCQSIGAWARLQCAASSAATVPHA